MPLSALLLLIVFLEGYAVLSVELLAIRSLIPFVGAGTDTVSIVIASVLLPLALGYHAGGGIRKKAGGLTLRQRLLVNWLVASAILGPALSYPFLDWLFKSPYMLAGWDNRVALTVVYTAFFIAGPVYLLGQTLPLLSAFFPRAHIRSLTGRILLFSTLGSFMGAVFCTLVLMTWLGVHYAIAVTIGCLTLMILLLARNPVSKEGIAAIACLILALVMNNAALLQRYGIVANNRYHVAQVEDLGNTRLFRLNGSQSSAIFHDGREGTSYIDFMEQAFIASPLPGKRKILVIGAGGFTLGDHDTQNEYTFLDLDPQLQSLAERTFLKHPLSPNKKYEPVEARAWLNRTAERYDVIILDAFNSLSLMPEHLTTQEFFLQIKSALNPGGVFAANIIASPSFADSFSVRMDNTLRSVFPHLNRQVLSSGNNWSAATANIIYSYYNDPSADPVLYTDDRNTSAFDRPLRGR